jgi:hypothetical protein
METAREMGKPPVGASDNEAMLAMLVMLVMEAMLEPVLSRVVTWQLY